MELKRRNLKGKKIQGSITAYTWVAKNARLQDKQPGVEKGKAPPNQHGGRKAHLYQKGKKKALQR